jgi:hypothetical protein
MVTGLAGGANGGAGGAEAHLPLDSPRNPSSIFRRNKEEGRFRKEEEEDGKKKPPRFPC